MEFGRESIIGRCLDKCTREVRETWEIADTRDDCISEPSIIVMAREKMYLKLASK